MTGTSSSDNWQPNYNPDSDPQAARIAWESSPLASVKTWRSPVLLIQGDDDRNVQFSQTVRLAAALRAQGTPFEEHVFPDEIHGFLLERTLDHGVWADGGFLQSAPEGAVTSGSSLRPPIW